MNRKSRVRSQIAEVKPSILMVNRSRYFCNLNFDFCDPVIA